MKVDSYSCVQINQNVLNLEKLLLIEWTGGLHKVCKCCGGIAPFHESPKLPIYLLGHKQDCIFAAMIAELGGNPFMFSGECKKKRAQKCSY